MVMASIIDLHASQTSQYEYYSRLCSSRATISGTKFSLGFTYSTEICRGVWKTSASVLVFTSGSIFDFDKYSYS